ncbi:CHAT domain-containing protein [Microscilla marina]|nr:CHAT domain-containing tetratricopeptide repeat protein [Microscilla marina]
MTRIYICILLLSFSFTTSQSQPANKLNTKAHFFVHNMQPDSALVYYQKLAAIYKNEAPKQYYFTEAKIAEQLINLRKYTQAKRLLDQQLRASVHLFNPEVEARLLQSLAKLAYAQKHYKVGFRLCEKAEKAYQSVEAITLDKIDLHVLKADFVSRLAYFDQSLSLIDTCMATLQTHRPESVRVAYLRVKLYAIQSFIELGGKLAFDKSLETCYKSLKLLKRLPTTKQNLYWQSRFIYRQGLIYKNQQKFSLAYQYYRVALQLNKQVFGNTHQEVASSLLQIGRLYAMHAAKKYSLGRQRAITDKPIKYPELDSAFVYYRQSLKLYKKKNTCFKEQIGRIYSNLAYLYTHIRKYEQAEEYFQHSYEILSKVYGKTHPEMVPLYNYWGALVCVLKKYSQQLEILHKGLLSNAKNFNNKDIFVAPPVKDYYHPGYFHAFCTSKAMAFANRSGDLKDLKASLYHFEVADSLIKHCRNRVFRKQSHLFTASLINQANIGIQGKSAVYTCSQLYRQTKKAKYLEKAFYFIERGNSSFLMQALAEAEAKKISDIPRKLLDKERSLRKQIVYYEHKQGQNKQDSLVRLNMDYETLIAQLEKEYPRYAQLKLDVKQVTIQQLQQSMPAQTATLMYTFGVQSNNYVFVITKNTAQLVLLPKAANIQAAISHYYNQLSSEKRLRNFAPASYQGYKALFKPAEKYLKGIRKLVVIAPSLENIPFEAMITQLPKSLQQDDFSKLNYLGKHYQISYHYSATLWYKAINQVVEQTVAPELHFLAFAPFSVGKGAVFNTIRGANDYLPESGLEVKSIYNVFKSKNLSAEVSLAKAATKDYFIQKVKTAHIVHIASHSEANTQHVGLAKIHFAEFNHQNQNFSGCLLASEVYNLELNADLLVLSSCESGVGKLIEGEGVFSLARSFLYAGARNIVFSLWEIDDYYTRELMVIFYQQFLTHSMSYSRALQIAQQKMVAKGVHPKHWSGIVMIGK